MILRLQQKHLITAIIPSMKSFLRLFIKACFSCGIAASFALFVIVLYLNAKLPSVESLKDAQLQLPLKIYTLDGKLIGEYGEKRRSPIEIDVVPQQLKLAILATEDSRFYEHNGVDLRGLARAGLRLIVTGTKSQGASTITMQVARNFFLTRKKTFARKLNEILLAIKIEKTFSKDEILELYLNKIYFGKRAYGVEAAARVYYGTSVTELNLAQMAMIAGLPQAPSAINPLNNPKAALKRRTHVLKRMRHYEFISEDLYQNALAAPLSAKYHGRVVDVEAPHVAEMARREIINKFGRKAYTDGFEVYTTIDSKLQTIAQNAVQEGLLEYDKRHGYRGPIDKLNLDENQLTSTPKELSKLLNAYKRTQQLIPALVKSVEDDKCQIILPNAQLANLEFKGMKWARKRISRNRIGNVPQSAKDVVSIGDVIYVEPGKTSWVLSQIPDVQGALVATHPNNGAILALIGGFDFSLSNFNRANQAARQAGSNFKPFVYAAALESGFTPASIINDAPVVYEDDHLEGFWRPQNDSRKFYGPTRLRVGLTQSRNLVSIRLLQAVGVENALDIVSKFGFDKKNLPHSLSLALGTSTTTPMDIVKGYATFANGGYDVEPFITAYALDDDKNVLYNPSIKSICYDCNTNEEQTKKQYFQANNSLDQISLETMKYSENITLAKRVLSPQTAFIMTSILQDAIQSGTGRRARSLNRSDLAGKTGTTNNKVDAWYSGFNQSLATTVWVGFDEPRSINEYGSQAALPIWIKFMGSALKGIKETRPIQPAGLVTVKIDPETGLLARPGQSNAIFEIFQSETAPQKMAPGLQIDRNISIIPSVEGGGESLF
jgi:penicillin-binding protein 1A